MIYSIKKVGKPSVYLLLIYLLSAASANAQVKNGSNRSAKATLTTAKTTTILTGPMVGYADMKEVAIWVQTTAAAQVAVQYTDSLTKTVEVTDELPTKAEYGNCVTIICDKVEPGNRYTYAILINGKLQPAMPSQQFRTQPIWAWRTDPPATRIAFGSCNYVNEPRYDRPGKGYGDGYGIFNSIYAQRPDVMLWVGDNTYLREPDWNTKTGIIHRYTHTRAIPETKDLLAGCANYAIWDDHDYGPNDSDRGYWQKNFTEGMFNNWWANPNTNATGRGGITGTAIWADVQFFFLDDRYHRAPDTDPNPNRDYYGAAQLSWLRDALLFSKATFKLVVTGNQVLNSFDGAETLTTYPAEREKLLAMIAEIKATGVIFITGDRHHTQISKLDRPGTYSLYDITCSPFTSGVARKESIEVNKYAVTGTEAFVRNFGLLDISGPRKDRLLKLSILDTKGTLLYKYEIRAQDLK